MGMSKQGQNPVKRLKGNSRDALSAVTGGLPHGAVSALRREECFYV